MDFIIGLIREFIAFNLLIGSYMAYGMAALVFLVTVFTIIKAAVESLTSFIRRTL